MYLLLEWSQFNFVKVRGVFFLYELRYEQEQWRGGCIQACNNHVDSICTTVNYYSSLLVWSLTLSINIYFTLQQFIITWSKNRNAIKCEHLIFRTYSMPEASYLVEVAQKACAFLLCTLYGSQVTVMKITLTTFHSKICQQSDTQL